MEPEGSKNCRRKILMLVSILVIAGIAGADPHEIIVFGITPSEDWGLTVLGLVAMLAHLYWYLLPYQHLKEDGKIEMEPSANFKYLKLRDKHSGIIWREADLLSNRVAFVMTGLAWSFITFWIIPDHGGLY